VVTKIGGTAAEYCIWYHAVYRYVSCSISSSKIILCYNISNPLYLYKDGPLRVIEGNSLHMQCCWGNLPWVPWASGYSPKLLDMIGSLPQLTAGDPYTPYQETTPPLQAEEMGLPT
jgi:hypothetical protein